MPEPVAQVEHAPAVVGGEDLAFLVQVRDVVHERVREALLVHVDRGARRFDRPEVGGEIHLLVVVDVLAGEHEHRVPVHRCFDLRGLVGRNGRRRSTPSARAPMCGCRG